jgi:hypothetical protein
MTWHDSAMLRFRQWAKRQVRTGYGGLDFATRFGPHGNNPFRKQIHSARCWGLGWPLAVIGGSLITFILAGPGAGLAAAGAMALTLPAQMIRIAVRNASQAGGPRAALAYGALTVAGKWFQLFGQSLFVRDRLAGRHARLIEYKFAGTMANQATPSS